MVDWLRRLWPGKKTDEPTSSPSGDEKSGRLAAFEIESRVSDALVALPGTSISSVLLEEARNARERGARLVAADGGPAGCVETALGLSMTGKRATAFVAGAGLSTVAPSVSMAARMLSPLVIHAWIDGHSRELGHADLHRLEGTGALLAMAASPQEASDLAITMRMAAEATLCPAVLAIDGHREAPASPPDWARLNSLLGHSQEEIRAHTPTQVDVFGRNRPRVPAWLDPVHPMSIGAPADPIDAGMIAAGKSALFGSEVMGLVRSTLSSAKDLIGRPAGLVRRRMMDDAEMVLVAQGEVAATAEAVASELRAEKGWRIGVLGVTWLSPFPESDLVADLAGRRAVMVIERTLTSPGDEPPLVRRVRAATRDDEIPIISAVSAGAPIQQEPLRALCSTNMERLSARKGRRDRHPSLDHHIRLDIIPPDRPCELPRRAALESRVKTSHPELAAQILSVPACASTNDAEGGSSDDGTKDGGQDKQLPALLRRIGKSRVAPDSLPRVWGEVLAPRKSGPWPTLPDPIVGTGAMPALSTALLREPGEGPLPSVSSDGCTGCGCCWASCPEAAIGCTVTGLASLLDSAAKIAGTNGEAAETVRRAHPHIARRAAKSLDDELLGVFPKSVLQDAWDWASGKLGIADDDLAAHDAAFSATLDVVEMLRPMVTDRFFHEIVEEAPANEVLILATSPEACSGCGLCAAECPEGVIEMEQSPDDARSMTSHWAVWERIEDTSGATCARAASDPEVGEMAARLLSRHAAQAMIGSGKVPGSGERLSLRLTAAISEHHGQVRAASLQRNMELKSESLGELLRSRLSAGLTEADMEAVVKALGARSVKDVKTLADALDRIGSSAPLDRDDLFDLANLTRRLERAKENILHGADGLGRARFTLILGGYSLAERVAPYPEHPFFAPLVVETSTAGGSMALGVAEGLADSHLSLIKDLRRADIELESPPDRPGLIEELENLRWSHLTTEERAGCPPVLFAIDEAFLGEAGAGLISRLLSTDLPIKILLLDGLQPGRRPEPSLLAIAQQRAFVLASSIGHPDHLAGGLDAALTHPGPAFVHLHSPVPDLHGFPSDQTMERARAAIASRAHVLLSYDPAGPGELGLRISLDENPSRESATPRMDLLDWAAGESRFGEAGEQLRPNAEATYKERWLALRELAGESGDLAERLEAEIRERIEEEHTEKLAERERELDQRISEAAAKAAAEAQERLTDKLVDLATAGMEER